MEMSMVQEAQKKVLDRSKGKESMWSFKSLREKYGRRTAERIRDNKKSKELSRDPAREPRPHWFTHPEVGDDPATGFTLCTFG